MKRTFGKILSFALVLAMLLAMVPAVLAADTTKTFTAAMGVGDEIVFPRASDSGIVGTLGADTTWSLTTGRYGSSASDYATLKRSKGAKNVVTAKKATGSTTLTLTAKTTVTEGRNSTTYTNTWNVTITEWGVTLSSSSMDLAGGNTSKLTATISGPDSSEGLAGATVTFKSNQNKITLSADGKSYSKEIKDQKLNRIDGTCAVWVKVDETATDKDSGVITVTVEYLHYYADYQDTQQTETLTKEKTVGVYVTEASQRKLSILNGSTDVTNKTISATTSTKSFTLTASLNGSTSGSYSWTSSDTSVATIGRSTGAVVIKGEGTTTITVTSLVDSTKTAECDIKVSNDTITIDSITYSDSTINDLETKNLKFSDEDPAITNYTVNTIGLVANLSDPAGDGNVEWKIDKPSFAKFVVGSSEVNTVKGTTEVTLKAEYPGEVKVTATVTNANGKTDSKSMTIQIWTAKAYNKQVVPSPVFTASTALKVVQQLAGETATITLESTGRTEDRPLTDVKSVTTNGQLRITGKIDGIDSKNSIIYYPKNPATGTFTLTSASASGIEFFTQPASATYKVNADFTGENLYVDVGTTQSGYTLSSVKWYNAADTATTLQSENCGTDVTRTTSTLSLKTLVDKGFITGPGDYTFQCLVTAKSGTTTITGISNVATVTISGDYFVEITAAKTEVSVGDTFTVSGVAQTYNPSSKKYVDVSAAHNLTWTLSDSSLATLSKTTSAKGATINVTATAGGKLVLTAKTTINGKDYEGTKTITISTPKADDVRVTMGDDDTYVLLDGSKISDAVKAATKSTPSTFTFKQPSYGTVYTSSSLSSAISTTTKYSASEVSKMAFKPTRTAGSYTIEYTAYVSNGELATGKIIVMTSSGTVTYHISANESQTMQVSDFQSVYGSGLSSVKFGTASDSRGALYKGSSTSSGKVGSESYYVSTGTTLLKNVTFIAGSSTAKYSVVIPFTAYGSNGEANGNLVIYVNDTHSVYSTGATFKSMAIADELAPESNASSAYITITSVVGGKLYTQYSKINSCTALAAKDLGSTRFSFSGSNSIDNLYVLPLADSKTVEVNYTINGSDKGTLTFKVVQQTASSKFTDVSGSFKWAANSVDFMYGNGLVNGISTKNPNVFGPGQNMTRAMLVTILYRAAGEPSVAGITNKFTDNKQNQYYYEPVLWASSKGIVNGATATTFDPDGKITREQIAAILYRYAGSPAASSSALNGFADQSAVSSYAVTAMQWAVGNGIITGVSTNGRTTLSAKNNATRAQVSVMLHRFLTMEQ